MSKYLKSFKWVFNLVLVLTTIIIFPTYKFSIINVGFTDHYIFNYTNISWGCYIKVHQSKKNYAFLYRVEKNLRPIDYTDIDWVRCVADWKSTSGYMFQVNMALRPSLGNLRSKQQ